MHIDVAETAEAAATVELRGRTALVVDVLRASTTIIAALAAGCAAVVPVRDAAEARRRAARAPAGALVAGERRGEPLPGADLGNSPLEFVAPRVQGRVIFLTTSNGTRALLAARRADRVGVAALVNARAAVAWAAAAGRDVALLCAGERGAPALEDTVCAGLLVEGLLAVASGARIAPGAEAARRAAQAYGRNVARLGQDAPWARALAGRGRARDVTACLALDTTTLVPVYRADVDRVVAGPR